MPRRKNFHDLCRVKKEDNSLTYFGDEFLYTYALDFDKHIIFVAPLLGLLLHNSYVPFCCNSATGFKPAERPGSSPSATKYEFVSTGTYEAMVKEAREQAKKMDYEYLTDYPAILLMYEHLALAVDNDLHMWRRYPGYI